MGKGGGFADQTLIDTIKGFKLIEVIRQMVTNPNRMYLV